MRNLINIYKSKIYNILRKSEKHTKTDMVYLVKGGFLLTFGQFIASISAFLLAIAFANLLSKNLYGTYKYIISVFSFLLIFTLPGINTALLQAVARGYEGSIYPAIKTKIKYGLFGSVASLILSIYYYINGNNTLFLSFLIVSVFIPLTETFSVYGVYLNGKKLFGYSTRYYVISRIISVATLITTMFLTKNIVVILLSYFIPITLLRLFFLNLTKNKFKPNQLIDPDTISYGKHLSIVSIFGSISSYLDNILLFHYLGAVGLATYAFALAPIEQITASYKSLSTLAIPKLSNRKYSEINELLYKRLLELFLLGIIISALYIVLSPYFFSLVFPKYSDSVFYTKLLAIILALKLPLIFLNSVLKSRLNITPKIWLYWRTFPNIVFILMLLVLTPIYGIIGVIISKIIFNVTTFIVLLIQWLLLANKN